MSRFSRLAQRLLTRGFEIIEEGSQVKGLANKVVLVTGAARGIGRAIATRWNHA
jgi:FlaA1/EpsC-like NDP-sugar epimerase